MGLKAKRQKTRPWCTWLPRSDLTGVESLVTVQDRRMESTWTKTECYPSSSCMCVLLTSHHIMEMKWVRYL